VNVLDGREAIKVAIGHDEVIYSGIRASTAAERVEWRHRAGREALRRYPHEADATCTQRAADVLLGKRQDYQCTCGNAGEREDWLGAVLDVMNLRDRNAYKADLGEVLRLTRKRWNKRERG
jgi:hypothetical protein